MLKIVPADTPSDVGGMLFREFERQGNLSVAEVRAILADESSPAYQLIAARLWIRAINGDHDAMGAVFDALAGCESKES